MLLKTVEGKLGFVVDEDFKRLQGIVSCTAMAKSKERTLAMNFLHVPRISLARVALNIMTCLW